MKIGENAPDFTLKDGNGKDWTLSEQAGNTVVLLFYPGDNTPVCTKQLCSVRDNWSDYQETGAVVVGISTDSVESHSGFADEYDLPLPLLADVNGKVSKMYGATSWIPGKSARAVVVIDEKGRISYHYVQPLGVFKPSDSEVLKAIAAAN
ncbi:MAG: peroxiredoxin [Pyrinomonadaceae bacterium]|nr:peroxiredoxin [Pyrinomonadaceae bacterium]